MSKHSSQPDPETMPFLEAFKKLKRLKPLEPSLGVLGFFFASVCVILCFVYLDDRAVLKGFQFPGQSERFMWLQSNWPGKHRRVEFLEEEGGGCDVFEGGWVWTRRIRCINPTIAGLWMKGLGARRMGVLICFIPSGDGNPGIATCPGT